MRITEERAPYLSFCSFYSNVKQHYKKKAQIFPLHTQFIQHEFPPTVIMNNHDLPDENATLKVDAKCPREDANATISALS